MLERLKIFAGLPRDEIDALERQAVTPSFPKNVVVLMEGDKTDALYVILEGRVKVFLTDADGREIVVNTKQAGDYFGELAILTGAPRVDERVTDPSGRILADHLHLDMRWAESGRNDVDPAARGPIRYRGSVNIAGRLRITELR